MRKKRKENLRLQLKQAKLVQLSQNSIKFKEKEPLTNVFLLKQSYVALIADFQKQRKRILLCERYIDELENRNRLLISSLTNSKWFSLFLYYLFINLVDILNGEIFRNCRHFNFSKWSKKISKIGHHIIQSIVLAYWSVQDVVMLNLVRIKL